MDGRLVVIAGASRSGKTAYVRDAIRNDERILAWDPEDQFCRLPGWKRVTTRAQLLRLASTPGPIKAGFVVGGDLQGHFDYWAGAVMYSGRYVAPLTAIAEELADVTTSSKAPGNWGILLRRGLKRGITIYAISQRWAEADKTAIGNASEFVLFRQSSGDDVLYLSRKTRVPAAEIDALTPVLFPGTNKLKEAPYVKIDKLTGNILRDKLTFSL